ncbi:FliH/SctL family protein [Aeromonas aquatica]|uniref:FliH/SctL family protein n=1 Tax=Aeromonas aquatica TaxID=558964 RepID=UPI00286F72EB|nr:FliH/SctL family protein [Aeromonas aquatica]
MPLNKKKPTQPSTVHRYHFPAFSQEPSTEAMKSHEQTSPLQIAAKYQAMLEEGRDAGFSEGLHQGLEQGQLQGMQLGQERGFKAGQQEGREAGAKQAYAETQERLNEALHQADQLYRALDATLQETLASQREILCRLVGQICRQVLRAELALKPAQILPLIEESLAMLPSKPQDLITIRLDPATLVLLKELAPEQLSGWKLQADPVLSPGSFSIQTGLATAESRLDERVELSIEQLKKQTTSSLGDDTEQEPMMTATPEGSASVAPVVTSITGPRTLPWSDEDTIPNLEVNLDGFSDDDFRV